MKNIINKIIDFFADISFKKKEYRPLTNETLKAALCENDFYQVCIKSKNNNIVARAISYFSGPYSHSVIVYKRGNSYYVNLFAELYELMRKYYKASFILYNFPELIVLASSDANGIIIIRKFMMNRIQMNILKDILYIFQIMNRLSFKILQKQTSFSVLLFINSFCIRHKKLPELITDN